jgi:hypothetical protein
MDCPSDLAACKNYTKSNHTISAMIAPPHNQSTGNWPKVRIAMITVEINWQKPTGRKIASADPGMTADETREVVPAKYNTDSTLTVEIGGGDVEKDFALASR